MNGLPKCLVEVPSGQAGRRAYVDPWAVAAIEPIMLPGTGGPYCAPPRPGSLVTLVSGATLVVALVPDQLVDRLAVAMHRPVPP